MVQSTSPSHLRSTIDRDAWRVGWKRDGQTMRTGPTWIQGRDQKRNNAATRNTWIETKCKKEAWTPGPGAYNTMSDFQIPKGKDLDAQFIKEKIGAKWTFGKTQRNAVKTIKEMRLPSEVGPGQYHQYTTFGIWKKI